MKIKVDLTKQELYSLLRLTDAADKADLTTKLRNAWMNAMRDTSPGEVQQSDLE